MIHIQTKIKIKDNTGAKLGQCIKIYKKKTGTIGDTILISIKSFRLKKNSTKISKGDLFKAFIVQTKYGVKSTIGNFIKFDENCIILLNNQSKLLGTRVLSPLTTEFRKKKFFKILSLSSNIL